MTFVVLTVDQFVVRDDGPLDCQGTFQNAQKGLTCVDFYTTFHWGYLCGGLSDRHLEVLELFLFPTVVSVEDSFLGISPTSIHFAAK